MFGFYALLMELSVRFVRSPAYFVSNEGVHSRVTQDVLYVCVLLYTCCILFYVLSPLHGHCSMSWLSHGIQTVLYSAVRR